MGIKLHARSYCPFITMECTPLLYPAPSAPLMVVTSEEYSTDNITVIAEWIQEGVSYNISIVPMVPTIFTGRTSVQLIMSYNIEYNLSLAAVGVCQSVAPSILW